MTGLEFILNFALMVNDFTVSELVTGYHESNLETLHARFRVQVAE